MAKKLRNFAPGYADVTPTPDYCEAIFWEQRCEASSYRAVIYGSNCGRFCAPPGVKWGKLEMWSAGGAGAGGNCCQQGPAAAGGNYMSSCVQMTEGWGMCYVVAHGGCCFPARVGCHGCFTTVRISPNAQGCFCTCGGRCGPVCCYFGYCCYDRTGQGTGGTYGKRKIDGGGDSSYPVPQWKYEGDTIRFPSDNYNARIPHWHHGRAPHLEGMIQSSYDLEKPRNANNIPVSKCCYGPYNHCCTDLTVNNRCDQVVGEHCAAAGFCQKAFRQSSVGQNRGGYGGYGHAVSSCYSGCAGWGCGDKNYTTVQSGVRTSGPRWMNLTSHNNWLAHGGWHLSQWHLCHNGSNNQLCYSNIRTVGFGGHPTRVCAGPCCCGGWGGLGLVQLRYRGSPGDEKVCHG